MKGVTDRPHLARGPKPWGSFASGSGSDKVDGAANSLPGKEEEKGRNKITIFSREEATLDQSVSPSACPSIRLSVRSSVFSLLFGQLGAVFRGCSTCLTTKKEGDFMTSGSTSKYGRTTAMQGPSTSIDN